MSNNPESNMKLSSGTAPVVAYRKAGVSVGLGTDGAASNNDLDMFEAMRQAAFQQKLITMDPTAISAPEALEMATIGGARVLGQQARVGSLEPGKRADWSSSAWRRRARRRSSIRCRRSFMHLAATTWRPPSSMAGS